MLKKIVEQRQGVRRVMYINPENPGRALIITQTNVDPILQGIARQREVSQQGKANKLTSRIPLSTYEKMMVEGKGMIDPDRLKHFQNSEEGQPWRIWRGKV